MSVSNAPKPVFGEMRKCGRPSTLNSWADRQKVFRRHLTMVLCLLTSSAIVCRQGVSANVIRLHQRVGIRLSRNDKH
jgi:hypothetical protein